MVNSNKIERFFLATMLLSLSLLMSTAAEEAIIQQEKISFEKCLKVITTSQDKLSVALKLPMSRIKSVLPYLLVVDGTLTITCDGIEGNVTVSTNTN